MSRKKMKPVRRTSVAAPPRYLRELDAAEALIEKKRLPEARAALERLAAEYPHRYEILVTLANVALDLSDMGLYERTIEQLVRMNPNDPDLAFSLAGAYMQNTWPAHALVRFRRVLERWPDYARAEKAREAIKMLEETLPEMLGSLGLTEPDDFEIALMHEEIQRLLNLGDYRQVRAIAKKLLDRRPNFASALNNISLSYYMEGDPAQAIRTAESVLDTAPGNIHALSNLVRFYCLEGCSDKAREYGERLKAATAPAAERELKITEALSFLGDDAGVLDVYERTKGDAEAEVSLEHPMFHHLVAVAAMRQGQEARATEHWEVALTLSPGFDLALSNQADLKHPIEERHAPWPFSLQYWINQKTIEDLAKRLDPVLRRNDEEGIRAVSQAFLRRHPELVGVLPMLLDRGDPRGRQFALHLARAAGTPELMEAIKEFALGWRGPDAMRMDAANLCRQAGLLGTSGVTMWLHGEWHEIQLIGFEIYEETEGKHSEKVQELVEQAHAKLVDDQPEVAEALLRQALEMEPDAPDIMNNLAAAYSMQQRNREAESLIREIHERFPDYFFGITNMAAHTVYQGDIKAAQDLLNPLLAIQRLHVSEFRALAMVQVEILLAEGKREGAESWLQLWEQVDPDDSNLARLRLKMQMPALRGLFSRKKRR